MAEYSVPIAIVGIGCRFPGGAHNPEKLWHMLAEGHDAWSEVPRSRYNWKSFHHPNPDTQAAHNQRGGHFIDQDVAAFDARFFGVPPAEADAMDPQQRILLEIAYEALENAGIPLDNIQGSNTGVYVATFAHDYESMMTKDTDAIPKYLLTGIGNAMLSNRISYVFDLKGPSITLDTACSGSLVALHQACQSLRLKETDLALTGGTNIILSPDLMVPMSLLHFLNDDGKSYAFDSRGSGYGRGEGVAIVALKRLEDALKDGDHIRAVIRGTGVGQDGKTSGITLPNGEAQQSLIRSVYQSIGLDPRDTTFVEAHGTGTVAGDTTEINAMSAAFGCHDRSTPLYVHSVKSSIGHTESSAGIAGLVTATLALEKGFILPNPNLATLKGNMMPEGCSIQIPQRLEPWPNQAPRRASVNSFGYGGTNAHAVLEALDNRTAELVQPDTASSKMNTTNGCHKRAAHDTGCDEQRSRTLSQKYEMQDLKIIAVTAKSEASLVDALDDLRGWVSTHDDSTSLAQLAYTLTSRRTIMPWRYTFVAATRQDILSCLKTAPRTSRGSNQCQLIFVFTGQGAQWFAMGKELIATSHEFRKSVIDSDRVLQKLGAPWSLIKELSLDPSKSRVDESEIGQPATTAIQIALVDLFYNLGINANIALGHSSGEIAAAYCAGALTKAAALKVSYHRGFLANRCKELISAKGAMLAVGLGENDVSTHVRHLQRGKVVVACANSYSSTTVSGDEAAIMELEETLKASSIFAKRLKVDTAYHSHHMESVASSYFSDLSGLQSSTTNASVKFFSTVIGRQKTSDFGPSYWVNNLVSKVRFCDTLENICHNLLGNSRATMSTHLFMEIGPHHALAGPTRETVQRSTPDSFQYLCLPSLVRGRSALQTVLESTGKLFERGSYVQLHSANSLDGSNQKQAVIHDLPPYPWDHSAKYWQESRLSKDHRMRQNPYHDLLGLRVVGTPPHEPVWRHFIGIDGLPWLQDHVVDGFPIFPASGYISMAIEAKSQISRERRISSVIGKYLLRDVNFVKALVIPESPGTVEIRLSLTSINGSKKNAAPSWESFRVSSIDRDGSWHEHCHGSILSECIPTADDFQVSREREESLANTSQKRRLQLSKLAKIQKLDSGRLYHDLQSKGNFYGPSFAVIQDFYLGEYDATGIVIIPDVAKSMPANFLQAHTIHPATLDALIHSCLPIFAQHSDAGSVFTVGLGEMTISASLANLPGKELYFATSVTPLGLSSATIDLSVFQESANGRKELVIETKNGEIRGVSAATVNSATSQASQGITYQMKWAEDPDLCKPRITVCGSPGSGDGSLSPEAKLQLLNRAASVFITLCLDQVREDLVKSQQLEFYRWMVRFHASQQSKDLRRGMFQGDMERCIDMVEHEGVEGEALCRVGRNLTAIVSDGLDPISLMLEDDLLYRAYADDGSSRGYAHMIDFLKPLIFKNPNMTMLEIGAGTGGATFPLLQRISRNGLLPLQRYDFTDISSGFFERAKLMLQEWESFINFKILDISSNVLDQGFIEGSYDLVIASNALHVTSSVDHAIANARRLLKPGGRLLLVETTRDVPFVNMLSGILPGWYIGANDGRVDSPLLSTEQWDVSLRRNSFNGIEFAANDHDDSAQRITFIASRAISHDVNNVTNIPITIVDVSGSIELAEFSKQLGQVFNDRGWRVTHTNLDLNHIAEDTIYVIVDNKNRPLLANPSSSEFRSITQVFTLGSQLLWINVALEAPTNTNPEHALVTGFTRSARMENERMRLVTLDMQDCTLTDSPDLAEKISDVLFKSFATNEAEKSDELEYIYNKGRLHIPRLIPNDKIDGLVHRTTSRPEVVTGLFHQHNRPLKLHVETPGLLDSLRFVDDLAPHKPLGAFEIEIQVAACGLNFKDVIVALGQMKGSIPMVGECAGTITGVGSNFKDKYKIGDRVCACCATPFASRARVQGHNIHRLPNSMSFIEGASIPTVFMTAYYGLVELAHLQRGQSVLVHAAAGGVGQAALRIAQHIGATVFATVGNATKRQFLMDTFNLPEDHIFSSRSGTFKKAVHRLTDGKGVDVILNSLSGELLRDSWACISRLGSFVEIGKTDILSKSSISLEPFDKNVTFASVDLTAISTFRPETNVQCMASVMSMFEDGMLQPVQPIKIIPMGEIEAAFRLLQSGKHIGKVVLEANEDTVVKLVSAPAPPIELCGDATYVIAGGLGGLGLEIARFMAARGVRHIALLTRRDPSLEERQAVREDIQQFGAEAYIFSCDIANRSQCIELVSHHFRNMPPVKGLIQAAMVLKDGLIDRMELDDFKVALQPKVNGTRNLLEAFDGSSLNFFIMLSSVVSVLGSRGSANYAAGNAFQDALANSQTASGAHCVSINLGPMKESGILTRNVKLEQIFSQQGLLLLKNVELFALLEYAMSAEAKEVNCKQIVVGFNGESLHHADNNYMLRNPMLKHVHRVISHQATADQGLSTQSNKDALSDAQSMGEVRHIIARHISQKVSTLVVIDLEKVDCDIPMAEFGLDSLVMIELKNWIARNFLATLQTSEIADAANIAALAATIAAKSTLVPEGLHDDDKRSNDNKSDISLRQEAQEGAERACSTAKLPAQPLPDLHDTLETFLVSASAISSHKDFETTKALVRGFTIPSGPGQHLHERLVDRASDPSIENWYSDIYLSNFYLRKRNPLIPHSSFFGAHPVNKIQMNPAEKAAAISLAAFQCKTALEAGEIGTSYLLDKALHTKFNQWLFNSCREPHMEEDRMRKYAGNDYLVALRHGRPFKVMLKEESEDVPYAKLMATFQAILDEAREDKSWIGILTADGRSEWAEYREHLRSASLISKASLHVIEAAAFLVCLDDARPETPNERAFQFFFGNGINRWYDKSLQFIVCDNGTSATVCEHSLLDGTSITPMKEFIVQAMSKHQSKACANGDGTIPSHKIKLEELTFSTSPIIESRIEHLRRTFKASMSKYSFAGFEVPNFGSDFFSVHKCASKSGVQLLVQLASYYFYGYNPPAIETVSLAHFQNGRVGLSQTVWPQVVDFCTVADNTSVLQSQKRALFFDAATALAKSLARVSKGQFVTRYILALSWMLLPDEPRPALFDDPVFVKSLSQKVATDCLENDLLERGLILRDPGTIWIHFQVLDDRVTFSIWGNEADAKKFQGCIERAKERICEILS